MANLPAYAGSGVSSKFSDDSHFNDVTVSFCIFADPIIAKSKYKDDPYEKMEPEHVSRNFL